MRRTVKLAPLSLGLAGAGVGICMGMLFRNQPGENRVLLVDSVPLAAWGALAGILVGFGVSAACDDWPRLHCDACMTSSILLGAAIMAQLGWIAGGMVESRPLTFEFGAFKDFLPILGMEIGAAVGAAAGFALGLAQLLIDQQKSRD